MAAPGLAHLKSVRAGHKGVVTKKISDLEDALNATPVDPDTLKQMRVVLQEKFELLKKLSEDIVALLTEEVEIVAEVEAAELISDSIRDSLLKITRAIGAQSETTSTPPPTPSSTSRDSAISTESSRRVKLPELNLRPFDGNYINWLTFWDTFKASIHDSTELSDVVKFSYLVSLLRGSAKEAIAGLSLTSANYKDAVDILTKRFGDQTQIKAKHMDALMSLEPVMSLQNLIALRRLHDTVETHVRGLRSLGVAPESYGALLSPVIMKKLPQELRVIISRKVTDQWNLDPILEALLAEIDARERAGVSQINRGKREKDIPTGTTLYTNSQCAVNAQSASSCCCYCRENHNPTQCTTITTIEERKRHLKKQGKCFNCLRKGHLGRDCKSHSSCKECKGRHHTSICHRLEKPSDSVNLQVSTSTVLNPEAPSFSPTPTHSNSHSSTFCVENDHNALLQTACTTVFNPRDRNFREEVRIIFDCGSQRSYVTDRLKEKLHVVPYGKKAMSISTFGSTKENSQMCDLAKIGVCTNESTMELCLLSVPYICGPISGTSLEVCKERYEHLRELDLADTVQEGEPELLIGADYYWKLVTGEKIEGNGGPVAIYTKFGWVLSGPVSCNDQHTTNLVTHVLRVDSGPTLKDLDKRLRSFWDLESLGVTDTEDTVLEQFSSIVTLRDGRYEVSLPWKDPCSSIPDNLQLSQGRLHSLLRRLRQTPDILREYDNIIQQQLQKGIVEIVDDPHTVPGRVHYLPHHAVIRKDKETSKVRVVYDASARDGGLSLNDCLYSGPKFNQRIFDLLIRFRCHQVALTADIEKAFLMISVSEKDRDVLRFLWVRDPIEDPPQYIVLRFARVVFGVSCSPFLLNATVRHHLELHQDSQRTLVDKLLRSFYVDDVITGADTEEDAFRLYTESKELLKSGGFNLCKFTSNNLALQQKISIAEGVIPTQACEETYTQRTLGKAQPSFRDERKVLGVIWNVDLDEMVVDLRTAANSAVESGLTKRHIVSLSGRFYDPIGIITPVIITFKVLIQELCKAGVGWDEPLEGKLLERWQSLMRRLRDCPPIRVPRCYYQSSSHPRVYELHGFSDASSVAYASVIYLLIRSHDTCITRIVASKSRVAPIQQQTIPRLELLGALLLSRLMKSVLDSLEMEITVTNVSYYTDSQV